MLIRLTNARTGGKPVFIDAECIAAMAARTDDRQGTLIELKNDGGMWTVEEDVSAVVALVMKAQAYPADTPYPLAVPDVAEEDE